jgi:hypothetical protein
VPSFLEACARLAARAAEEGKFAEASQLIEKAARVAKMAQAITAASCLSVTDRG